MSKTENTTTEPTADVTPEETPDTGIVWTSEEDRDAYLAEVERRKAAGESLDGLDMPVAVIPSGDSE